MTNFDDIPDYGAIFDLSGKTAVVTGACGILGRHFCAALAAHGANIAVVDLDREQVDDFAAHLTNRFPGTASGHVCDVADPAAVQAMTDAVADHHGGIDILHNNAVTKGSSLEALFAPPEEYAPETWRELMAVNLDGIFFVLKTVGAAMKAGGRGGSIIQTSSIYGLMGPDNRIYEGSEYLGRQINNPPPYAASKSAIIGLTRYFAAHWGPNNIRVNAIAPGGVESGQNERFQQQYGARVPMGRMGRAAEVVGVLVWLASDASSYVTGQVIAVDGGLSAW